MRRKAILIVTSLSILLLNGCSKTIFDNEDVRCPFVERGGCQSMNDINKMVSQKRYTRDGSYVQQGFKPFRNIHSKAKKIKIEVFSFKDGDPGFPRSNDIDIVFKNKAATNRRLG